MQKTARELRSLLAAAEQKAPFVLVGHSMGGPIARWFEMEYPDEVAGMVLVDATTAASSDDAFSTVTSEMRDEWETTMRRIEGQDRKDIVLDLEALRDSRQTLGARPLVTITAGRPAANLQQREALRTEFQTLSSNAIHVVAADSEHLIPLQQPQLVTDAARAVVSAVRSAGALSPMPSR
jgi:pimeloyl-ACP methyl ester carboxylesterase